MNERERGLFAETGSGVLPNLAAVEGFNDASENQVTVTNPVANVDEDDNHSYDDIVPQPETEVNSPEQGFDLNENQSYGRVKVVPQKTPSSAQHYSAHKTLLIVLIALIAILILSVTTCSIAFTLEILKLKSETGSVEQQQSVTNNLSVDQIFRQLQQDNAAQDHMLNTLNSSINATIQLLQQASSQIQAVHTVLLDQLANSCASLPPTSPSGYYWVRASNDSAARVYCNMTLSCGNATGGWMRVAGLDMTNSSQQCPSGFKQRNASSNESDLRSCVREASSPGCTSLQHPMASIPYTKVCGKVIAYQVDTTDAFGGARMNHDISSAYVDGVSLTHGDPKKHIWTFAAANDETTPSISNCLCMTNGSVLPPNFVGLDYFCDTGLRTSEYPDLPGFLGADPLWDGAGCESPNTCCSFNSPPWFYRQLPAPTTDDIEMRLCRDQDSSDEDVAVEMVEIYVQ